MAIPSPKPKFRLMPRDEYEDGSLESIEDWIKRESKRLVDTCEFAQAHRDHIEHLDKERARIGEQYGAAHSNQLKECKRIKSKAKLDIQKIKTKERNDLAAINKPYRKLRSEHGAAVKAVKAAKARYNTYTKKFFNAVSTRVFQNIRSICGVQHSWSDKKVKRDIMSGEVNKGSLRKKKIDSTIESNPIIDGES